MFKITVEIATFGHECAARCRFLGGGECRLWRRKLRESPGWANVWLRCADCKKAEKAAENADA